MPSLQTANLATPETAATASPLSARLSPTPAAASVIGIGECSDTDSAGETGNLPMAGQFRCFCGGNSDERPSGVCVLCGLQQHLACSDWRHASAVGFTCADCALASAGSAAAVKGTLIITPALIESQWVREITKKAAPSLRVLRYRGVRRDGFLRPSTLAGYDVVITTYTALRGEIHHVDVGPSGDAASNSLGGSRRSSRHVKRYPVIPSAIARVQWWRVCLDEAQMVDSSTSQPAAMAAMLPAVNRWCVTGT